MLGNTKNPDEKLAGEGFGWQITDRMAELSAAEASCGPARRATRVDQLTALGVP